RQSPELLAGALKVRAAQGDVTTARLYPNPTLSFGAGNFPIGRTNPPGIGAGDTVNEQVGIGQELVLWGKRGERIAAAHGRVAAAEVERRQAVAELLPLLGLDVADLVPVGELRLPAARTDTDTLVSEALRRRPDLTAAEREAEAAEAALRLARAERWPNVTVG